MIRKKLNLPEPTRNLNHYKKSKERKHYSEYYDKETRGVVESVFKEFLDRFNYRFS